MQSLVVLFALAAVACGSYVPLSQPAYHPALVLDPHGRPLDTAEVINARALHLQAKALDAHHAPLVHAAVAPIAHSVVAPAVHAVAAPALIAASAAVSHQSRVDLRTIPAVVAHAAPVVTAHVTPVVATSYASPLLGHSTHGIAASGHWLKKRSLGHLAYSAPIYAAPAAVSHQSRVDVISSPAVVSHAVTTPVLAHAVAAPVVAQVAPAAVSHQSRVDVRTSPVVVAQTVVPIAHSVVAAPLAHSVLAAPTISTHSLLANVHGHGLYKRSLAHAWAPFAHVVPAAVSHQERVDVISSPAVVSRAVVAPVVSYAAPVAVAHAAPAAVSHQSRVDVISSAHVAPIGHSAVWTAPAAHWARAAHW